MPIICLWLWLFPQDPKPLPELKTFLAETRTKLQPDEVLRHPRRSTAAGPLAPDQLSDP